MHTTAQNFYPLKIYLNLLEILNQVYIFQIKCKSEKKNYPL